MSEDFAMTPPDLGPTGQIRGCNRWMTDRPCGAIANWHVIWDTDMRNGIVCDDHAREAQSRWVPISIHPFNAPCMIPGSLFVVDENRCVFDDGLAVAAILDETKETP